MRKLLHKAIFCTLLMSFLGCSDSNDLDQQIYVNQKVIANDGGDSLYLVLKSWGLNGNQNLFTLSRKRLTKAELIAVTKGYLGVERLFYKVSRDTLELRLEHKLAITSHDFPNWIIIQSTYNGSELKELLTQHTNLGYNIIQ